MSVTIFGKRFREKLDPHFGHRKTGDNGAELTFAAIPQR